MDDKLLRKQIWKECDLTHLLHFVNRFYVVSDKELTPEYIKNSFIIIEDVVKSLEKHLNFKLFNDFAHAFLIFSTKFVFEAITDFLASNDCTPNIREVIIAFIKLGVRALREIKEDELAEILEARVNYTEKNNYPILDNRDLSLLYQINLVIDPYFQDY